MFGKSIRPLVFWPPFLLLLVAVVASLIDLKGFLNVTGAINDAALRNLGWLFMLTALVMIVTCVIVFLSPLGRVRIGGEQATHLLTAWRWFSITLCTTVAVGIMFWSTAEPLYHLHSPPESMDLAANSPEAARFALSTMFLHWSFTPYAIYTVPALVFALMHYNRGKPFSLGALFTPLIGDRLIGRNGVALDALALFAIVCGMAASLGTGMIVLAGGIDRFVGAAVNPVTLGIVAIAIVATFTMSAASGLQRGIAVLSNINTRAFMVFLGFVFLFGPTQQLLGFGTEAAGTYFGQFLEKSLFTGGFENDSWPKDWTIFYWANWMTWAPITGLFLGRISRGYTVRQFMLINLVAPALFSIFYVTVFSGGVLQFDLAQDGAMNQVLQDSGPGAMIYALLNQLPLSALTAAAFLIIAFLSYVTAADSNTDAISRLCSAEGESALGDEDDDTGNLPMKIIWGTTIGAVAWIMTSFAGIDGIKMLSNLGGIPALFILIGATAALLRIVSIGNSAAGLVPASLSSGAAVAEDGYRFEHSEGRAHPESNPSDGVSP